MNIDPYEHDRELIVELCKQFYHLGWASGTGGGMAIRQEDGNILICPSGVQKERMRPNDLFVIDLDGNTIAEGRRGAKLSECTPLFLHAFKLRGAGAVIHSHSMHTMLATRLPPIAGWTLMPKTKTTYVNHIQSIMPTSIDLSGFEMIKGLRAKGCYDKVSIPIIENTAKECDLADTMALAIEANPEVDAVLVRSHGMYVWGNTWEHAKTQAECLDYLLGATIKLVQLGMDPRTLG